MEKPQGRSKGTAVPRLSSLLSSAGAGFLALGGLAAGTSAGFVPAAAVPHDSQRVAAQRLADKVFSKEAAPRLNDTDAVNLASAPAGADPVGFNRKALAAAKAAPRASDAKSWRQVGPTGAILNDPNYATDEGRLPTTGIVLAIAADPVASKAGKVVYIGTGGGLFKTTNAGASWHRAKAIPAVPVAAVAVDADNHRNVYAVTGQGFQGGGEFTGLGAYYSHDFDKTWHPAKTSVRGAAQQVAVAPDGTVFVATTGGLFRSHDRGVTYKNVLLPTNKAGTAPAKGTPVGSWTSDVVVQPHSGQSYTVFAAVGYVAGNVPITHADGTTTMAAPGNGLYVSKTRGSVGTFKRIDVTSAVNGWEQPYGHISSDPIGRTRLTFSPDGKDLFALVADAGHRSAGVAGPADPYDPLGIPHPTSLNGIYRSADNGKTWDEIATSEALTASPGSTQAILSAASLLGYNTGIQAWYNGYIAFDPNGNRLVIGEEEVYQSLADATISAPVSGAVAKPLPFQAIDAYVSACGIESTGVLPPGACPDPLPSYGGQVTHPDQHGVALVNQGSGKSRIWIGNDGGVFRQDHASGSGFANGKWISAAHLNQLLPYRAVEGSNGEVIAGLQDNGTNLYLPGANNSFEICGGDGTWVGVDKNNPNVFYCNANGALYVTTDGGKTTTEIDPCPASGTCGEPVFEPGATAMDPFDSNHIALATQVVYETTKGPNTSGGDNVSTTGDWKQLFDLGAVKGVARTAEALDVEGKFMYVGACATCQSSVKLPIKDIDRSLATNVKPGCTAAVGTTKCWHFAKLIGMPHREIYAVSADPRNVNRVYIATIVPSVIKVDFGGTKAARVLMSTDGGDHVTDMSGNLPRSNVWDIKVIGSRVYAATDYGVFVAKVGSTHWSRLGKGMPVTRVFGLNPSANRKDLVAATYGAGVWIYPLASSGVSTSLPNHRAAVGDAALPTSSMLLGLGLLIAGRRTRRTLKSV
jgi:hypothetical protein